MGTRGTAGTDPLSDPQLWLRRFGGDGQGGEVRLICFPHAGGSASFFLPVARALAPHVEVLAVQYPGRQDRRSERCVDDIGALADHITAVLDHPDGTGPDLPTAFFGHSMGAVTAYEVARRILRAQKAGRAGGSGRLPFRLFASGRRAPSRHRDTSVHLRDDNGIIEEVTSLGGTESMMFSDPELRAMVLPALRSDYRAIETYRYAPGGPAPCPVTVLTGDADPQTTLDEARAWVEHAPADGFEFEVLPGGHFFLVDRAPEVLSLLRTRLLPAPADATPG